MTDKNNEQSGMVGRFIKRLGRWFKNFFFAIGISVTILYIILLIAITNFQSRAKPSHTEKMPKDSFVLEVKPRGTLHDQMPNSQNNVLSQLFQSRKKISVHKLKKMLERAAKEEKVKAILLDLSLVSGSPSSYYILKDALIRFKESEKPLWIHHASFNTNSYLPAMVADHISTPPLGGVDLTGPAFQMMYFADTAEKVGVKFNVFRAGKYKSAFEPLVRNEPSEATLEEMNSLEESMRLFFMTEIAKGRDKDGSTVSGWMRRSFFKRSASTWFSRSS